MLRALLALTPWLCPAALIERAGPLAAVAGGDERRPPGEQQRAVGRRRANDVLPPCSRRRGTAWPCLLPLMSCHVWEEI